MARSAYTDGFLLNHEDAFLSPGINRTAWGTKLLLTAVLAHPVDCTSLGLILKAPNGCFGPPSASQLPPPLPTPPIYSTLDNTGTENLSKKQEHSSSS